MTDQRSQPMSGHTELPWSVGANGRSIAREVPGMSDGFDHYMVAVLSAHSLLPASEASANAAFIVEAVNNYERLTQESRERQEQICATNDRLIAAQDQLASARKALQWIVNSRSAHPANMVMVAEDGLKDITK